MAAVTVYRVRAFTGRRAARARLPATRVGRQGCAVVYPTLQLLAELEKADYNVAACRVEVLSMRHHLEMPASFFRDIRAISESAQQQGLRLRISEPGA